MRDVGEEEKTIRSLKGIMNKLTPEKFDVLVEKVKELDINNVHLLIQVCVCQSVKSVSQSVKSTSQSVSQSVSQSDSHS